MATDPTAGRSLHGNIASPEMITEAAKTSWPQNPIPCQRLPTR